MFWRITQVVKKITFSFCLALGSFAVSFLYYSFFAEALNSQEWLDVKGFTRIIIPDSFLYRDLIDKDNILDSLLQSNVKNAIGPSLIWIIAQSDWVLTLFFNAMVLFATLLYTSGIAKILGVKNSSARYSMVLLAFLPSTVYHSVGALKEIPSMLFVTGFFFHYLKQERFQCFFYAVMGVMFRSQVLFVLGIFFVSDKFHKKPLLCAVSILLLISAIYPILNVSLFASEASQIYREDQISASGGGSLGALVEGVRGSVPILSIFAILFRVLQSIFEPFISFWNQKGFLEQDSISLIYLIYFVSLALILRHWLVFLKNTIVLLFNPVSVSENIIKIHLICLSFVFPVGGFSFIHHRYLYPVTALILIVGDVHKSKSPKKVNFLRKRKKTVSLV
jgi:hypothetical protein